MLLLVGKNDLRKAQKWIKSLGISPTYRKEKDLTITVWQKDGKIYAKEEVCTRNGAQRSLYIDLDRLYPESTIPTIGTKDSVGIVQHALDNTKRKDTSAWWSPKSKNIYGNIIGGVSARSGVPDLQLENSTVVTKHYDKEYVGARTKELLVDRSFVKTSTQNNYKKTITEEHKKSLAEFREWVKSGGVYQPKTYKPVYEEK